MTGYYTIETYEPVGDGKPDMVTFFKGRAQRRAAKLNAARIFPSYRYEVCGYGRHRWAVVAFQNIARPSVVREP